MRLVFFCSGYSASNVRLQPWLTFAEVGRCLAAKGHDVTLATDGSEITEYLPLPTCAFPSLRGTHSTEIVRWLDEHKPDRMVVSITPFSLVTAGWHGHLGHEKAWGYLPYALYSSREFKTAWSHLATADRWGYGRNLLVPGTLWRRRLRQRFWGVICQSQRTAQRLMGKVRVEAISPGVDLNTWQPSKAGECECSCDTFLYLGSALPIHGYTVLLEAIRKLPAHLKLRVLARGLDGAAETELKDGLELGGLAGRVSVIGGWLTAEQLKAEIQSALAVVLPFVLVPSEVPVSVLEVIACGTPAIVTDVDGLPESVGAAGVVVPPGDATALAAAMLELAKQPEKVAALRQACVRRRGSFQDWDAIAGRWAAVLQL